MRRHRARSCSTYLLLNNQQTANDVLPYFVSEDDCNRGGERVEFASFSTFPHPPTRSGLSSTSNVSG